MAIDSKVIRVEGMVEEALPGLLFRVKTSDGHEVLGHLAGRLKINRIRVIPGDRVIVEMVQKSDRRGRIVKRM